MTQTETPITTIGTDGWTHTADLGEVTGITTLPEEHFMTTAVDNCIALPGLIGSRWPLDNLRAAERWWMA